jgi:hypothetical protein
MFTELKEGKQYSFSIELSSKDFLEQNITEIATFFDKTLHKRKRHKRHTAHRQHRYSCKGFQGRKQRIKSNSTIP